MTDRSPMEALLERLSQQRREMVITICDRDEPKPSLTPFVDRYLRKTHPTSPRKHRHD